MEQHSVERWVGLSLSVCLINSIGDFLTERGAKHLFSFIGDSCTLLFRGFWALCIPLFPMLTVQLFHLCHVCYTYFSLSSFSGLYILETFFILHCTIELYNELVVFYNKRKKLPNC